MLLINIQLKSQGGYHMNNDNEQNTLSEEFSTLKDHFLPDGALIKGVETLGKMKDDVIKLDNALLQLAKSSNLSATELKNTTEKAFQLGNTVGRTGTEVLSYVTSAKHAGYDIKESMALAEEALKMTNISTGIDNAETAIEHFQNILDGFDQDTDFAETINDALAGISQTGSVNFDTLADGASKLADSAKEAGMSFEEMLGLLTGAYVSIQDMDAVTSGELSLFSTLKEKHGEIDNVYDALKDLHKVWNTLDAPSKESFAISNAGEDQKEIFTVLMDNWNGVEQAVYAASNSFGAANTANEIYLDSISGKTAAFQNQMEQLSSALISSDLLKFFIDLGTTGVGALNSITDKIGSLGTLGALAGSYLGVKNLGRANLNSCPSF